MKHAAWATVRDGAAPLTRAVADRAFALSPSPAPFDILNCADWEDHPRPHMCMAIFGLLPIADPPPHHFPWGDVGKHKGPLLIHTRDHEQHYRLFVDTRPTGWAPRATIVRAYTHLTVVQ